MRSRRLYLVRHGAPAIQPNRPASQWQLAPTGFRAVAALRHSGRLPDKAAWFSSPEPKAIGTARLLTNREISVWMNYESRNGAQRGR